MWHLAKREANTATLIDAVGMRPEMVHLIMEEYLKLLRQVPGADGLWDISWGGSRGKMGWCSYDTSMSWVDLKRISLSH